MKPLQKIGIAPGKAMMVIVDMENEFCKPGGKLYSETSARIMPGIVSAIAGLAERARSARIPVIYVQSMRKLDEPEFTAFGSELKLQQGTWAVEIVDELKPHRGDVVVPKFSHDAFYETELDQLLQRRVSDPTEWCVVVTGGMVNVCVYHAVMGFHLRNYWTVVPVDGVYYGTDYGKQAALEQFSLKAYPNVLLSRSDLIEVSEKPEGLLPAPV